MKKIYSIIIPTYNCCQILEKTLKSVVSQDENLYECIIVDGKSTDKTLEIIHKYKNLYSDNIKFISEPDKGIYDAMNKGIELIDGEYLYFIGAGDILLPNCLNKVMKYLNFDLEMVYGNTYFNNGLLKGYSFDKKKICISNICHQSIFYNKKLFKIIGKYDLKYQIFSDYDFNIKIFGNEFIRKRYIDISIANYLGNGVSDRNIDIRFINDFKKIVTENLGEHYYKYYLKSGKHNLDENRNKNNDLDYSNNFIVNSDLIDLIENNVYKEIIIFGTSSLSEKVIKYIKNNSKINIKYFMDNDESKQGQQFFDKKIIIPRNGINSTENIPIIIASSWDYDIRKQLEELKIRKSLILTAFL